MRIGTERFDGREPDLASLVGEIIELADLDLLDLGRTRRIKQEVLDLLDDPETL